MANFQLSPENTAAARVERSEVAGTEGGADFETSYNASVRETASFTISLKRTAVDVR